MLKIKKNYLGITDWSKLKVADRKNSLSLSELLGKWQGKEFKQFRKVAGLIIILFLGVYAAAQLNAGSKALFVMLGLPDYMGAIIGAVIVIIYCFSGGMRASLWTDVVQSIVMFIAMGLLCVLAVINIGGGRYVCCEASGCLCYLY